jgi:hypothetical protein
MQLELDLDAAHKRDDIYYIHERLDKLEAMCNKMRRALFGKAGEQEKRLIAIEEKVRSYERTEWAYATGDCLFDDRRIAGA